MRSFAIALGLLLPTLVPLTSRAQAWVGEPNSLTASLGYNFGRSDAIPESRGLEFPNVIIYHHAINVAAEYVTPIEGLAVDASLPLVGTQWDDSSTPHPGMPGPWDDGDLHFAVTDLRAGARYQVLSEPLAASVHLAGSIPTNDYHQIGYTAPGRGLMALHLGASFGRTLDPWLPKLYVHGQYEFSFVERYDEIPEGKDYGQNRSDLSFQVGYFVLDNLEVNLAMDARETHGGFDFVDWDDVSMDVRVHHDPLLREGFFLLGPGMAYQFNAKLSAGVALRFFLGGHNTRNAHMGGTFLSYRFF